MSGSSMDTTLQLIYKESNKGELPFQHYHVKAVAESVQDGSLEFNKQDLLQNLREIRYKESTIGSAFEETAVYPADHTLKTASC
ncbi:hypothetical protein EMCG_09482 [[Emmonsia] crescens]|uniref:Uncharacterized protein n=1 Tax=[Emmonsia] crescens TaxID=73230 RepID=A0A0G2J9U8_9EURO|nr:hypothetical protein EMCG_09482 [Emmonsia crescens UAMH 3008]